MSSRNFPVLRTQPQGVTQMVKNEKQHIEKTRAKQDRKSTRLNSSHGYISYAVFCLKKQQPPLHLHRYVVNARWKKPHRLPRPAGSRPVLPHPSPVVTPILGHLLRPSPVSSTHGGCA